MSPQTLTTPGTAPIQLAEVRTISIEDIPEVLRLGWRDFMLRPSSILFLMLIYPVIGVAVTYIAFRYDLVGLVYPIAAGFALIGPISAVGVLELSRRHEAGEDPALLDAFSVVRRPSFRGIVIMALLLFILFAGWIVTAQRIMVTTLGDTAPDEFGAFLLHAVTTWDGLAMFVLGNAAGFVFAVIVLCISVVSLPMLVDGETSVFVAIGTSIRAAAMNPQPIAAWGLAVAVLLGLGILPVFAGLLIALPVLGHANWHLYRRIVRR